MSLNESIGEEEQIIHYLLKGRVREKREREREKERVEKQDPESSETKVMSGCSISTAGDLDNS